MKALQLSAGLLSLFSTSAFAFLQLAINASQLATKDSQRPMNSSQLATNDPGNAVKTSSGLIQGHNAPNRQHVTEYLGIPFAKPPVGNLRFAAPQPYRAHGLYKASTFYYFDCPANVAASSIADSKVSIVGATAAKLIDATQQFGATVGEDCLKLNIWSKHGDGENSKAVLFWLYGGGFTKGTTNSFLYDGEFLADTQDVIVVSANYRVSLFGFPGLPGMDQNVGLLDQRLAIEWVKKNIAAFGGDPDRITLFGQSAGAASIDYYSYAWTSDPIVNGFIAESGVSTSFSSPAPADNTNTWYGLTQTLGCGGVSAGVVATLACMRGKSMAEILAASATAAPFGPTADGKTVYSDYTTPGTSGKFIKKPMLLGNNDYEAGIIKVLFGSMGRTQSLLQWAILNLQTFTCPVSNAAQYRTSNNVPVWRYRYFGEFPNLRLTDDPSSGAWHGSEIANVFGTAVEAGLPNTQAETAISRYIMANSLVRLAYDNQTLPSFIAPVTYDYACQLVLAPGGPDMEGLAKITNLTELGGGSEIGY
ncbi:MAG: hypothetical protein ASARMPRED_008220 [Alectoria sarmentosa]|nr:MAG: hypothetical protein ASARMPRED_008220 [Alectoria sarmentosa]